MAVVIPNETLYAAHLTAMELKQELAVRLFQQDRLTLMQAAELAGMRPIPFQHLLASREISPHYDIAEFKEDMATLRQQWPDHIRAMAGAWPDFPSAEELREGDGQDVARETG